MRRAAAAFCFCLLAAPLPAAAEWHITPMVGLTFAGKTTIQDFENATGNLHPHLGISVTYLTNGIVAIEGLAVLTPGFFQTSEQNLVETSRSSAVMGNVMLTVPRRWAEYSLRPFLSGGMGLLRTTQNDPLELLGVTTNVAGFNIGGGAMGYFSKRVGVRFDLRYYSTLHGVDERASDDGAVAIGPVRLRYMTATVGVVIRR
jgi:hypothetical protein